MKLYLKILEILLIFQSNIHFYMLEVVGSSRSLTLQYRDIRSISALTGAFYVYVHVLSPCFNTLA